MAIVGPIPAYSNFPINAQYYKPGVFIIEDIALGLTTLVTTTVDHDYVIGQLVRLQIPPTFGSRQLNGVSGYVIEIPASNEVLLNFSSIDSNAFSPSSAATQAQIIAVGDINNGAINTSASNQSTFIPGSFQNISPQ